MMFLPVCLLLNQLYHPKGILWFCKYIQDTLRDISNMIDKYHFYKAPARHEPTDDFMCWPILSWLHSNNVLLWEGGGEFLSLWKVNKVNTCRPQLFLALHVCCPPLSHYEQQYAESFVRAYFYHKHQRGVSNIHGCICCKYLYLIPISWIYLAHWLCISSLWINMLITW